MKFDKSKVFTVLNASEVKIGSKGYFADKLTHLKERVSNKSLSYYGELTTICPGNRSSYCFEMDNISNWLLFYFVEEPEEKKYRPYHNTAEMPNGAMLDIVVSSDGTRLLITAAEDKRVYLGPQGWVDLYDLYKYYTWPDGTPCGVEEQGNEGN